jgi:hypothetical protein
MKLAGRQDDGWQKRRRNSAGRAADGHESPGVLGNAPEAPSVTDRLGKILRLSAPQGASRPGGLDDPFQDRSRRTFKIGWETMPGSDAKRVLIDPAPRPRTTPARPRSWCARTMRLNRRQSGGIRRGGTSRVRRDTSAAPECPAPGGQRAGR